MAKRHRNSTTAFNLYFKWVTNYTIEYLHKQLDKEMETDQYTLGAQLKFIWDYLKFMITDGVPLSRIKKLLSNQTVDVDKSKYVIQFEGGYPTGVFLYVDELIDIDFSDSFTITYYKFVYIYNKYNKKWKDSEVINVIKSVKEDLEFDGDKARIHKKIDKNILILNIKINEG